MVPLSLARARAADPLFMSARCNKDETRADYYCDEIFARRARIPAGIRSLAHREIPEQDFKTRLPSPSHCGGHYLHLVDNIPFSSAVGPPSCAKVALKFTSRTPEGKAPTPF